MIETKSSALYEVLKERERQDDKWGADRNHTPLEWLAILAEEFGEASKAVVDANWAGGAGVKRNELLHLRGELIQVAAVAVAFVECLDNHTLPAAEEKIKIRKCPYTVNCGPCLDCKKDAPCHHACKRH